MTERDRAQTQSGAPTTSGTETPSSGDPRSSAEAWREVGRRFESLGNSLARAFRTAWEDEATQDAVREMETGMRSLARSVADAVDEAASTREGEKIRREAEKFAASARTASEQAADEARPHLLAALKTMQEGIDSAIRQLQQAGRSDSAPETEVKVEVEADEETT